MRAEGKATEKDKGDLGAKVDSDRIVYPENILAASSKHGENSGYQALVLHEL